MVRQTKQRAAVTRVLQSAHTHPDAAWIHAAVREEIPNVSLGTVYRTLDALIRDGVVITIERAGQATRYDYKHEGEHHHHAMCRDCGMIFDVDAGPWELPLPPGLPAGFQVTDVRLEFMGVCGACSSGKAN